MVQNPRDRLEVCYTASVGQMWPKCHNDTCPIHGVNTLSQGQMCRCEPHLAILDWVAITHHATVLSWNTTDNKLPGNMSLAFISRNSFCLLRPWVYTFNTCCLVIFFILLVSMRSSLGKLPLDLVEGSS